MPGIRTWVSPRRYGLPHLLPRPTYTAPAGARQPLVRRRWMRRGWVSRVVCGLVMGCLRLLAGGLGRALVIAGGVGQVGVSPCSKRAERAARYASATRRT